MRINKTDWNLVSALFYALKEADEWVEKNPELVKQDKEEDKWAEKNPELVKQNKEEE